MRFDYALNFAGNSCTTYNLSLGPVKDLSIQIFDRLDGSALQIDFDANPDCYDVDDSGRTSPSIFQTA